MPVPPMIASLPHKHLCGRDCSDPHSTDDETEAQRDDMIIRARAQPIWSTHVRDPKADEAPNSALRASTCFV